MTDSLIPERPITVSPSLAASIGLEQAVLLQQLDAIAQLLANSNLTHSDEGYHWINLSLASLAQQLPFWQPAAIRRILQNLVELGMILTDVVPQAQSQLFRVAINQSTTTPPPRQLAQQDKPLGAFRLPTHWQPDADVTEQLRQQGVRDDFIQSVTPEFVAYWRERGDASHAWNSKFLQHVSRAWQHQQQNESQQLQQPQPDPANKTMQKRWQPSEDALEILQRMGIHINFIDDAVAEFILYWQERGEAQKTWNSKFVSHVKRQWARYTHTLQHDTEPVPIAEKWQPDTDVFDVLLIANIDADFARSLIPEFVLYWRDKNELHHSWNTKFLQHVKFHWAKRHSLSTDLSTNNEGRQQTSQRRRTKDIPLEERLTDRSWAN
jgi:hypothetical protein